MALSASQLSQASKLLLQGVQVDDGARSILSGAAHSEAVPKTAGLGELDSLTNLRSQMSDATKALLSGGVMSEPSMPAANASPFLSSPLAALGIDVRGSAASAMGANLLGSGLGHASQLGGFEQPQQQRRPQQADGSGGLSDYYAQLAGHVAMGGELTGLSVQDEAVAQEQVQQELMAAYYKQFEDLEQFHHQTQESVQLQSYVEAATEAQALGGAPLDADELERLKKGKLSHIICHNWLRGHCSRADACGYGHPIDQKGAIGNRGPKQLMEHNYKTSICKYFTGGRCSKGEDCIFAHGADELRVPGQRLDEMQRRKIQEWDSYVAKKQQHDREMKEREDLGLGPPTDVLQSVLQQEEMARYYAEVSAGRQPLISSGAAADPAAVAAMLQASQLPGATASASLSALGGARTLGSLTGGGGGTSLAAYLNVKRASEFGADVRKSEAKKRKTWNEWKP